MRKIESLSIKYIGYSNPENEQELDLEILGLETAISLARQRIAILKQSIKLQKIMMNSVVGDTADEQAIKKTYNKENK
jgi:hypothetical protein